MLQLELGVVVGDNGIRPEILVLVRRFKHREDDVQLDLFILCFASIEIKKSQSYQLLDRVFSSEHPSFGFK